MDEENIEKGYHATSVESANLILKTNFKKSISTEQKKHWLGNGVYFFSDIYWAVQWNINALKKKENKYKSKDDFTILKSKIHINELDLLDLSSVIGKEIFSHMKEKLENKLILEKKEDLLEEISKRSLKFFMNILEDYKFLDEFYVIKATYISKEEAKKVRYSDDFIMDIQCQICVRNIECIKETELYNDKNELDEMYYLLEKIGEENGKIRKVKKKNR